MAMLNGGTIVPFAAIAASPFNDTVKAAAMASIDSLAIAGSVGLVYACTEVFSPSMLKTAPKQSKHLDG